MPLLRKAGMGAVQQQDNPFSLFVADPTLPPHIKTIAHQYSKNWESLDPSVVDARVSQLSTMAQKHADLEQLRATNLQQQQMMNAFRQQGLENSKEARALTASIAQGNLTVAQMLAKQKIDEANNKPLTASLQRKEDENLTEIDGFNATLKELSSTIKALTPDPVTRKTVLNLGPVNNLAYQSANFLGNSTPESRAYADLQSAVRNAVNIKVSAEKGVQTDRDVVRFADALIAASGKNDTKATLDALVKFSEATVTAKNKTEALINRRRQSQNVQPLFDTANRNVTVSY
jgi:hypothetical protein